MSETIHIVDSQTEVTQGTAPEAPEYIDSSFDDSELFDLVSQNASVIVNLAGVEMTLSEAMWQIPINKKNLSSVISMVQELLAIGTPEIEEEPTEKEEPAEEEEIVEEKAEEKPAEEKPKPAEPVKAEKADKVIIAKAQDQKEQVAPVKIAAEMAPMPVVNEAERTQPPESKTEAINEAKVVVTVAEPAAVKDVQTESRPALEAVMAAEDAARPAASEIVAEIKTPAPAARPEARMPVQVAQATRAEAAPLTAIQTEAARVEPEGTSSQRDKPSEPIVEIIEDSQPEIIEPYPLEAEAAFILEEAAEPDVEVVESDEDELPEEVLAEAIDYLADADEPIGFLEDEEVSLEHPEAESFESSDPLDVYEIQVPDVIEADPQNVDELTEIFQPEQQAGDPIIEEAKDILLMISDDIALVEPETETSEKVNEILDRIIEIPVGLEADYGETITDEEAGEELEELFVELLDELGIDYAPEVIEELAETALSLEWTAEAEAGEGESIINPAVQSAGTHEVIIKLLAGLGDTKKNATKIYMIGQSALQLALAA